MKDIETWLKSRYSEQLIHTNSAFISNIVHDYCTEMKLPTRIQRKRTKGYKTPLNTCFCGRGSKWGNPFVVGEYLNALCKIMLVNAICKHPNAYIEIFNSNLYDEKITLEKSLEYYEMCLNYRIIINHLDLNELLKYDYLSCWCPINQKCHVDILINKLKI